MASKMSNKIVNAHRPRGGASRGGANGKRLGGGVKRDHRHGGISRSRPAWPSSSFKQEAFLANSSNNAKLIVSNLAYAITDSDLCELFSGNGRLISSRVQYDESGRSVGSAEVVFENRLNALQARKVHNRELFEGRELRIRLAASKVPEASQICSIKSRLGSRFKKVRSSRRPSCGSLSDRSRQSSSERSSDSPNNGPSDRSPGSSSDKSHDSDRSRLGTKPRSRKHKQTPTAEELDAELNEYFQRLIR